MTKFLPTFPINILVPGGGSSQNTFANFAKYYRQTGVLSNQLNEFSVAESGPAAMSVEVETGEAFVNGFWTENDLIETLSINTADITNPRIDLVILEMQNPTPETDADGVYIRVLTGTPAGSPVAPTLSVTDALYQIAIAQILVGTGVTTILDANITDLRTFSLLQYDPTDILSTVNLFKNFPSLQLADNTQPDWLKVRGTATIEEVDLAGEGISGLEAALGHARGIHCNQGGSAGDAANNHYQDYPFVDEPTLIAGISKVSVSLSVWNVDPGILTVELWDVGGVSSLATVTTATVGAGVDLKMENVTVGSTSLELRFYHSAVNGDYYYSRPMQNIGSTALPWKPRTYHYVDEPVSTVLNENPADANWADLDFSGSTSGLTCALSLTFSGVGSAVVGAYVRRNGSSQAQDGGSVVMHISTVNLAQHSSFILCDHNQIIEESVGAATVTSWIISQKGHHVWDS